MMKVYFTKIEPNYGKPIKIGFWPGIWNAIRGIGYYE